MDCLRFLVALEGDEGLFADVLLQSFDTLSSPVADRIAVGLFLEYARERLGKVAVLQTGALVSGRTRKHLLALVGRLVEVDFKTTSINVT